MASSVRFLQCAGFLFDSPFWDGPENWTAVRNQDLWQTFHAVLSLCQTEKIEFLFLTGDLFEQEYVRKETVERVAGSLAKLENTRIFITPGRRDPLIRSSAYRLTVWPKNVHIFSSKLTSVKIPSHNLTVYGAGWTAYHQEKSFFDGFEPINDDSLQLMLLHAMVDSKQNTEGIIQEDQISSSGIDYLGLGYQDAWSGIRQVGKTIWVDCGSVEARSFQDNTPHGVLMGEIQKESSQFEFRELGQRSYVEKAFTIQATDTAEGIAEKIFAETSPEERQKDLFKIKLSGNVSDVEGLVRPLQNFLETQFRFVAVLPIEEKNQAQSESGERLREKFKDGFPTLAQLFINRLQACSVDVDHEENSAYWGIVQKIGLTALEQGREVNED